MNFTMSVKERAVIYHQMETIGDCDKRIASSHIAILWLGWLLYEGHHGLFRLTCLHRSTPSSACLSALAPILLNHEVPPLKVGVICLLGGETKWETSCWREQSSSSSSVNFAALMAVRMLRVGWSCLTWIPFLMRTFNSASVLVILGMNWH